MKSIFAALTLGVAAISGAHADNIDTLGVASTSEIRCLGLASTCFQSLGQTFTVSGTDTLLTAFTIGMGSSGDGVELLFNLYAWDGSNTSGASLYQTSSVYGGDPTPVSFAPNIPLISGQSYFAVFSAAGTDPGAAIGLTAIAGDSYAAGAIQSLKGSGAWQSTEFDAQFSATFVNPAAPVPEPATYAMLLAGLAGLAGMALTGGARRFLSRR